MRDLINIIGHYKIEYRENGILLATREITNLMPTAMANHVLDVVYHGTTPVTTWYIGLINNTPTPGLLSSDTLSSHSGWTEWTSYTGNRKEWTEDAASARSMTSSAASVFTLNASGTIYGCFLASASSGTSGTLGSEGGFDAPLPVVSGGTLNVLLTLNMA